MTSSWLLLILSLPSSSATVRMRVWRGLKQLGAAAVRDGVYLAPARDAVAAQLERLCGETIREGGAASLMLAQARLDEDEAGYRALFDRSGEYEVFMQALAEARAGMAAAAPQELNRVLRRLRRERDALAAIDFFPGAASQAAELAWADFMNAAEQVLSPGEPQAAAGAIVRRDTREYRGRRWATRRRIWVDRVASAWLIRRFIDPEARFLWLEAPRDCPADALGFDFDGAEFTHVGALVSFEVLMRSFGLEGDPGLARLAALVRVLDVGEGSVPEAKGFEAVLAGARQGCDDDDSLLAAMDQVLDALHAYYSSHTD